jgi:hypothetical protein
MKLGPLSPDGAYFTASLLDRMNRVDQARRLLDDTLQTKQPFVYRARAEELLARLTGGSPKAKSEPTAKPASAKTPVPETKAPEKAPDKKGWEKVSAPWRQRVE